jgi:hypothetical protein
MCAAGVRENHSKRELDMPMKRYKPEQIVTLLRQVEVESANVPRAYRQAVSYCAFSWLPSFAGAELHAAISSKNLAYGRTVSSGPPTPCNHPNFFSHSWWATIRLS